MPLSRFEIAAARAMARYSTAEWVLLESSRRTGAIYAELRRLDTELTSQPVPRHGQAMQRDRAPQPGRKA